MSNETRFLVEHLIATRGDEAACRARLAAATARADEVEPWLHAFTYRPAHLALGDAAALPLAGLPIGVKDLIDTADMPTTYGSPIYRDHRPTADAAIVARIREAGGIVFGKTVSTEFAWRHPGPTVNPWNPAHTPGGSSSGSAAAVAAGIVPLALGTQTVGSVIRPAAYCGVVGYKPSFGKVPRDGVHPLSSSLDHVGFFARSVEGVALAHALFVDGRTDAIATTAAWSEYFAAQPPTGRLGVLRTPFDGLISAAQRHNFDASIAQLQAAGATLVEVAFDADLTRALEALHVILRVEAFRAIGPVAARQRELVSAPMLALIDEGEAMPDAQYRDALALQARLRGESAALMAGCDALLTVPAPGVAPEGQNDTGDPTFCAPWSLIGTPAINVPSGWADGNLPLGFQVIGALGTDLPTLRTAAWIESVIGAAREPEQR
jgi:Asp-tRNA(Asn)/Glu-tRNA(Gln) amidotransferase A subunit family amidase